MYVIFYNYLFYYLKKKFFFKLDSSQAYLVPIPTPTYPCQAIVLYDFEGVNEEEMSIRKDDKIFIEAKPDYEGWLIAKGRGRSGLVPESYVQLISPIPTPELGSFLIFSLFLSSVFIGLMKNSDAGGTKSKAIRTKKKSTSESTAVSISPTVIDDEADYFSDD
jgi:hypothetical protein